MFKFGNKIGIYVRMHINIIIEATFLVRLGNELGASSFPARNKLSMLFPYTSFPAGNELVLKLTKNRASERENKNKYVYLL
jgi:hypothetical protein